MRQQIAVDGFRLAYDWTGQLDGVGHFTPLECPGDCAAAITAAVSTA